MEKRKCGDCAYYIQHYAYLEGKFCPIFCGHCLNKRSKKINQHSGKCENFMPSETKDNQFVTKEYLTKTLLQHILTMELWEK